MKSRRSFLALLGAFICAPAAMLKAAAEPAMREFAPGLFIQGDEIIITGRGVKYLDSQLKPGWWKRPARRDIHIYNFQDQDALFRHLRGFTEGGYTGDPQ